MKIAIINENSQAPKNGIIEAALKKVAFRNTSSRFIFS